MEQLHTQAEDMSRNLIKSLNEAKNRLNYDLKTMNELTGKSQGYLSQLLKSGSCPLYTACLLALALGKELTIKDLEDGKQKMGCYRQVR